jgi:hypothetical protein
MTGNMGAVAAVIISDLSFRRQVERLCRHPRLMAEMLAEIEADALARGRRLSAKQVDTLMRIRGKIRGGR